MSSSTAPPQFETLAPEASRKRSPAPGIAGASASVWQRSPRHARVQLQRAVVALHTPLKLQSAAVAQGSGGHVRRPELAPMIGSGCHSLASTTPAQRGGRASYKWINDAHRVQPDTGDTVALR